MQEPTDGHDWLVSLGLMVERGESEDAIPPTQTARFMAVAWMGFELPDDRATTFLLWRSEALCNHHLLRTNSVVSTLG